MVEQEKNYVSIVSKNERLLKLEEKGEINWSALNEDKPGEQLAELRKLLKIDLQHVCEQTLIPHQKMQLLEQDDYAGVGISTFVKGYLRKYAQYLDVDAAPFIAAYEPSDEASLGAFSRAADNGSWERGESGVTNDALTLFLDMAKSMSSACTRAISRTPAWVFVCTAIVMWLMFSLFLPSESPPSSEERSQLSADAPRVPETFPKEAATDQGIAVDDTLKPESQLDQDSDATSTLKQTAAPFTSSSPSSEPPNEQDSSPQLHRTGELNTASLGAQARNETEEITERVSGNAPLADNALAKRDVLTMIFSDECWVEVRNAMDKLVFAKLQNKGDNLRLEDQGPFKVMLGNARAVSLAINGRIVSVEPPPGRKTRRLTVEP